VFGLGALNWTPFQPLEFAAKWNLDVVRNLANVEASILWTQAFLATVERDPGG